MSIAPLRVDGVIAFLIGRGFPTDAARVYAQSCVIRVVIRNESAGTVVGHDLRSWRIRRADGTTGRVSVREDWLPRWRASALPEPALVGFEWSQLPTQVEIHPGDSIQGMISAGLPPGSRLDLLVEWTAGSGTHREMLEGIACEPPS